MDQNLLGFSLEVDIDLVFVYGLKMTCFECGDRLTWFLCGWTKWTWFRVGSS